MKVVVGLGNPGTEYQKNRHNAGFILVDAFALEKGLTWSSEKKLRGQVAKGEGFILVKPDTFMNSSGDCVAKVVSYFKINLVDLTVIHDDVDLEPGRFILKKGSGSAGHHGVENIMQSLGSEDFWRLRVGVGRPACAGRPENPNLELENWVLSDLTAEEIEHIKSIPFPIG